MAAVYRILKNIPIFLSTSPAHGLLHAWLQLCQMKWKLAQEVPVMYVQTAIKDELIQRVRSEFLEMPGLQLNVAQACRLWGIDADTCGSLMEQLVQSKFLHRTRAGGFARPQ